MSGKTYLSSRDVEERAINGMTERAREVLDGLDEALTFSQRGPCCYCVYHRNLPGLYCLRQSECFPETRVLWRGKVDGAKYGREQPKQVLARS